jgi:single-stranded-DNA-specific exonuclease
VREAFLEALADFGPAPILLMGHNDADGLSSTAILGRAFARAGRDVAFRIVGRGENAWSDAMRAELAGQDLGGIIAMDLGLRDGPISPGVPALVIDHHVPRGTAEAHVITGFGLDPIPTTSLLAFWCAAELGKTDDLLWLAALGLIGDMAEDSGFREMADARGRYGVTALRTATSLINAARRCGTGDAAPALALLIKGQGPKDVTSGRFPETAALLAAKEEVRLELDRVKRQAPKVRNGVGLILFASPCQIHPLIAQQWRGRLKNEIVMAANAGFRPGWVHFAVRSARDLDLIEFLARHAPPGADENYGSGHQKATGGALRLEDWNRFIRGLGFDGTEEVHS